MIRYGRRGLAVAVGVIALGASAALAALPPVPVPAENPITEPKRVLGKILFWDEQLSSDNTVACFADSGPPCVIAPACRLKGKLAEARAAFLKVLDECTLAEVVGNKPALDLLLAS